MAFTAKPSFSCVLRILVDIGASAAVLAVAFGWLPVVASAAEVDFGRDILPLMAGRCFRCHGPDEASREADLRLDVSDGATGELPSGTRAVVPGDLEQSELWQRVTSTDPDFRMPPVEAGAALDERDLAKLRTWIESGADYTRHWSFTAPRPSPLPSQLSRPTWPVNRIDRWVLAKLDEHALGPNDVADRATLIRRVSLDLTGLPPAPAEVEAFLLDRTPVAYERLVDRLLASPAFGERWARIWLDLARYADSAGYAQDPPRMIYRYRDWVISALNANLPFDQFTIEQLAGDLLPEATTEQLLATAFHRNTMTNSEGGTDDEEFRTAAVVDRVNSTMQIWMGLTMGCAQCHSHKYDPITQEEYFQFYAVFNNTEDADRGDESPTLEELTPAQRQELAQLEQQQTQLQTQRGALAEQIEQAPAADLESRRKDLDQQIAKIQEQRRGIQGVTTPILRELPPDRRRKTYVQIRGNFLKRGPQVEPGVPAAFPSLPVGVKADRLSVARWLIDPQNPLTARVTVNRLWEHLFGIGLVETSEDFGLQGEPPSHPELLDDLALELINGGWDVKQLLRLIVTSATYRQSSVDSDVKRQADPRNRWLSRGPSYRLSAEMLRDQALAVAGLLSRKLGGPSVQPPRPSLGLRAAFGASTDWQPSDGEDRFRRGLYTSWRRTTPYPSMTTFDAPSREVCTIRRIRTNTPLQAFVTLNDPVFVEAAQGLARRAVRESQVKTAADGSETAAPESVIRHAFRLCLMREPTEAEFDRLGQLHHTALARFRSAPDAARQLAYEPLGPCELDCDPAELAALTLVANVLLNLDETLTKK